MAVPGSLSFDVLQEVQYVAGELPGVLQKREMADLRLQQQPCIGDRVRHELGVLALDRLVVVGVDDPGRHGDAAQLFRGEMGSVSHILLIWSRKTLNWSGVGDSAWYSFSARAI